MGPEKGEIILRKHMINKWQGQDQDCICHMSKKGVGPGWATDSGDYGLLIWSALLHIGCPQHPRYVWG